MGKDGGIKTILSKINKKYLIIGIIVFFVVVVGTVCAVILTQSKGSDNNDDAGKSLVSAENVCNASTANRFFKSYDNYQLSTNDQSAEELYSVVNEIYNLKNYDKDPNCTYMVLRYELVNSNSTAAGNALSSYKKIEDPKLMNEITDSGNYIEVSILEKDYKSAKEIYDETDKSDQKMNEIMTDAAKKAEEYFNESK